MTREQLIADVAAVLKEEEVAGYETQARRVIYMVLEAAAKECENLPGRLSLDGPLVAVGCARAVRAMKGSTRAEIGTDAEKEGSAK